MKDWTAFVESLTTCPDGHYWQPEPGDERTRIDNLGDIGGKPFLQRITFTACPRCGFESPTDREDVP